MLPLKQIGTPLHQHNAETPGAYEIIQRLSFIDGKRKFPFLEWPEPHEMSSELHAEINHGCWIVRCPCGNAPSAHPLWCLACCFECGAVYRHVVVPEDWRATEQVLLCRPLMAQRNWTIETLDQLYTENRVHGDPLPSACLQEFV